MQKRSIAMMAIAGCTAILLTGCGVKQEIHDGVVNDLNAKMAENDTLKGTIADLEGQVETEKKAARATNVSLEAANESLQAQKSKVAELESAVASEQNKVAELESDVTAEQAKVASAREATGQVEDELAELQEAYKNIQARWDQFEENLNTLDKTVGPASGGAVEEDGDKSAADLLNEMMGQ